jgi:hypothetical protein
LSSYTTASNFFAGHSSSAGRCHLGGAVAPERAHARFAFAVALSGATATACSQIGIASRQRVNSHSAKLVLDRGSAITTSVVLQERRMPRAGRSRKGELRFVSLDSRMRRLTRA